MQTIKLDVLDGLGAIECVVADPFVAARLELYFKQTKKMVLDDEARWPLPKQWQGSARRLPTKRTEKKIAG